MAPDVVLVTPGLHFGSGQADFVKSAQGLGIPAWMLLFSWDNLSTKGALHVAPDLMFVWNERQRREAVELHDYPPDRVVVVGAPRFDPFFALRSAIARRDFFSPIDLDPAVPTLLYLCSSRFIAEDEPRFIASWLGALRGGRWPAGHLQRADTPASRRAVRGCRSAAGRPLARTAPGHGMGAPSIRRSPRGGPADDLPHAGGVL